MAEQNIEKPYTGLDTGDNKFLNSIVETPPPETYKMLRAKYAGRPLAIYQIAIYDPDSDIYALGVEHRNALRAGNIPEANRIEMEWANLKRNKYGIEI